MTLTLPPCWCGGRVFSAELGGELLIAAFDSSCDACTEACGTCHTPVPSVAEGCAAFDARGVVIVDGAPMR